MIYRRLFENNHNFSKIKKLFKINDVTIFLALINKICFNLLMHNWKKKEKEKEIFDLNCKV